MEIQPPNFELGGMEMFALKLGFVVKHGNPNWNLWAGQAGPKTRPNGWLGLAQKGSPKGVKNYTKNDSQKDHRIAPKPSLFWGRESPNTLCIPCVFAQNGPPKGNQKGRQK